MNRRIESLLAVVAVAVLVAFATTTMSAFDNSASGQDKDNRAVQKWEYKVLGLQPASTA